jgi:hypothetical protein
MAPRKSGEEAGGLSGGSPEMERKEWIELNLALRALHKALIQVARSDYERTLGPIGGPGMLLRLLMEDPSFSWLRPMSRIMVEIDELLEEETPLQSIKMAGFRERIEGMISTEQYLATLQLSPDVVMLHTALRKALGHSS